MNAHADILERMSGANPLPDVDMITDGQLAEMTLRVEEARRSSRAAPRPLELIPVGARIPWLRPAVAFVVALLLAFGTIGIVSLVNRGEPDAAAEPSTTTGAPQTTEAPDTPAAPATPTSPVNRVLRMALTDDSELWAITLGGVVQWDLATRTHTIHHEDLGPAADDFSDVIAGTDGTVWLAGDEDLARFDGEWVTFRLSDAPFGQMRPGERVPMAVGSDGALWIAAGPDELGRFDGLEWEIYQTPYAADLLDSGWASDIAVSPDGTLWAALQGASGEPDPENPALAPSAVASFDGSTWTLYTSSDGLPDGVTSITVAPDGTVWAMSYGWGWAGSDGDGGSVPGEGVARFDGTWTRYTETDGLPSNESEIVVGLDGSIWAFDIEGDGISQFDGISWNALPLPPGYGLPAVVDAAGTLWMPSDAAEGGIIGVNGDVLFLLIVPVEAGSAATPTTTIVPAPDEWNSILADTTAGPTPLASACPAGSSPNQPGPIDQDRPNEAFNGMLTAVFDQGMGQIIYVDTSGETWGFDVCTNTWSNVDPSGTPPAESSAGLVYDADSGLTIALGSTVGIYDAKSNAWTSTRISGNTAVAAWDWLQPFGAVYDPVSGLVVTTQFLDNNAMALWAYDVDTDTWTLVGDLAHGGDLLGYSPELDRFIIATRDNRTMLLDPRSGAATIVATETPAVQFGWPKASYGPTTDTAFVAHGVKAAGGMIVDVFPGYICGFDPETSTWSSCFASPGERYYPGFGAIVGDPINDRLIIINGIYGNFWVNATEHVWAIDFSTGELSELLAPSE